MPEEPQTQAQPKIPGASVNDEHNRCFLVIVGKPFTGKTWAAATFPKPLFLDFDHKGKPGTMAVPFWNPAFVNRICPPPNVNSPPNKRDALLIYLSETIGRGIPADATLVVDSATAVEAAFHHQTEKVDPIPLGKGGKPDGFWVWGQKIKYFNALFELLKAHSGHVVYLMHEQPERTESGVATTRIKPLMSGSFADQIASHATGLFRQRIVTVKDDPKPYYVWDTKPNDVFECNNVFAMEKPTVKADYASIAQYFPSRPQPSTAV